MYRSASITEWISRCSRRLKRAYISFWGSFHGYIANGDNNHVDRFSLVARRSISHKHVLRAWDDSIWN